MILNMYSFYSFDGEKLPNIHMVMYIIYISVLRMND